MRQGNIRRFRPLLGRFLSILAVGITASAAPSSEGLKLAGALAGSVHNAAGIPQMGASVALYDRYDKLVTKSLSDVKGQFTFERILPDTYSVRVTLASFMPAIKRNISVLPGMRSVLAISLASALSSIELVSTVPGAGTLMSDDWKWVLRSTMTTRPILRAMEEATKADTEHERVLSNVFSDTRGVVRIASGESMPFANLTNQPDLGTSFGVATSVAGGSRLRVLGNVGYAIESSTPTTAFRTTFGPAAGHGPEYKLTVRQWTLPQGTFGPQADRFPSFRSASLTMMDKVQITDDLDLEFGTSLDTITFLDRVTYLSPFGRLNYQMGSKGLVSVAYSNGAPPVELLPATLREDGDGLQQDLAALSLLPRVSQRGGNVRMQRTETWELGYRFDSNGRTYAAAVYRENIGNGAVTVLEGTSVFAVSDLLPELNGNSAAYNVGRFRRQGVMASISQSFWDEFSLALAYGYGGALQVPSQTILGEGGSDLREAVRSVNQQWLMIKLNGVAPGTGTRFNAGYQWADYRSLMQPHVYVTNRNYPEPGLNIRIRQPIPGVPGMPGRLEATAELRNILSQGYLPLNSVGGRRIVLTNFPRALRGGVSFIF